MDESDIEKRLKDLRDENAKLEGEIAKLKDERDRYKFKAYKWQTKHKRLATIYKKVSDSMTQPQKAVADQIESVNRRSFELTDKLEVYRSSNDELLEQCKIKAIEAKALDKRIKGLSSMLRARTHTVDGLTRIISTLRAENAALKEKAMEVINSIKTITNRSK